MRHAKALKDLAEVLDRLKKAKARWSDAGEIDDAEDMWTDIPEMLDKVVPKMEAALAQITSEEAL